MSKTTDFKKDVLHEINMLKQHATQEELGRLDYSLFNHSRTDQCIYGQMTGECTSVRAKELMNVACVKIVGVEYLNTYLDGVQISNKNFRTNIDYVGVIWSIYGGRTFRYLSALEGYIFTKNSKNKQILQYLKGEIDSIKL